MKVRFYSDIWPGALPDNVTACNVSLPMDKMDGCTRFYFEVDFPIEEATIQEPVRAEPAKEEDRIKVNEPPWRKKA